MEEKGSTRSNTEKERSPRGSVAPARASDEPPPPPGPATAAAQAAAAVAAAPKTQVTGYDTLKCTLDEMNETYVQKLNEFKAETRKHLDGIKAAIDNYQTAQTAKFDAFKNEVQQEMQNFSDSIDFPPPI